MPGAGEWNTSAHPSDILSNASFYFRMSLLFLPSIHSNICVTIIEQNTEIIHLFSMIGFKKLQLESCYINLDFASSYSDSSNDADKIWVWDFVHCRFIFSCVPLDSRDQKHIRWRKDKPRSEEFWDWALRTRSNLLRLLSSSHTFFWEG